MVKKGPKSTIIQNILSKLLFQKSAKEQNGETQNELQFIHTKKAERKKRKHTKSEEKENRIQLLSSAPCVPLIYFYCKT